MGLITIPFGTARLGAGANPTSYPHAQIDPAQANPLRLNSGVIKPDHETLADANAELSDQFALLHMLLSRYCDPWSRSAKLFLERYFDFIRRVLEQEQPLIEEKLRPFGSVYEYMDYCFSAWLPLPQAHVLAADEHVKVDFAFWSGRRILALNLTAPGHASARQSGRPRLDDTIVTFIDAPFERLAADADGFFRTRFPAEFSGFWRDEPFPSGPLKPDPARLRLPTGNP